MSCSAASSSSSTALSYASIYALDLFTFSLVLSLAVEVWGKTLGILAVLNMGWYLIMPIGRVSIFLEALYLSWERSLKYHRWCGFYSVILMLIHGIFYVAVWINGNGNSTYDPEGVPLRHNLVAWGCPGD